MIELVRATVGSHLHGTATEDSDTDIVVVYIPSKKDLLLNKGKASLPLGREEGVDIQYVDLRSFIGNAWKGDPKTIDVLLCKEQGHPIFERIRAKRDLLVNYASMRKCAHGIVHQEVKNLNRGKITGKSFAHAKRVYQLAMESSKAHKVVDIYPVEQEMLDLKLNGFNDIFAVRSELTKMHTLLSFDAFKDNREGKFKFQTELAYWEYWVYNIYIDVIRGKIK